MKTAQEALKVARDALQLIQTSPYTNGPSQVIAGKALADTATIEQPEVASVDSNELENLLARYACHSSRERYTSIVDYFDAHCAQQVAAKTAILESGLHEAERQLGTEIKRLQRERDGLKAQLAARGEPVPDIAEIVARFPELNMNNYTHVDVERINDWGIELCEAWDDRPIAQPEPDAAVPMLSGAEPPETGK